MYLLFLTVYTFHRVDSIASRSLMLFYMPTWKENHSKSESIKIFFFHTEITSQWFIQYCLNIYFVTYWNMPIWICYGNWFEALHLLTVCTSLRTKCYANRKYYANVVCIYYNYAVLRDFKEFGDLCDQNIFLMVYVNHKKFNNWFYKCILIFILNWK